MKRLLTAAVISLTVMTLFIGCGGSAGSDSAQIGRARMIGNENLKLKKKIADKDSQIKDLEQKLADLEAEKAKISQDFDSTNFKLMQLFTETGKNNEALTAENQKLKEELEQLKK